VIPPLESGLGIVIKELSSDLKSDISKMIKWRLNNMDSLRREARKRWEESKERARSWIKPRGRDPYFSCIERLIDRQIKLIQRKEIGALFFVLLLYQDRSSPGRPLIYWCPANERFYPYSEEVISGINIRKRDGKILHIPGLKDIQIPTVVRRASKVEGIRRSVLERNTFYYKDLTEYQLEGLTYKLYFDYLIGIKSCVFIPIPESGRYEYPLEEGDLIGVACFCSPIPGYFGEDDRKGYEGNEEFFEGYIRALKHRKVLFWLKALAYIHKVTTETIEKERWDISNFYAHEVGNLYLFRTKPNLTRLRELLDEETLKNKIEIMQLLEDINWDVDSLDDFITEFQEGISLREHITKEPIDVKSAVIYLEQKFFSTWSMGQPVELRVEVPDGLQIKFNKFTLFRILKNLIQNSADAIGKRAAEDREFYDGKKGMIKVLVAVENDMLKIRVEDNGIPFPDETDDQLFSYTSERKGLFLIDRYVKALRGRRWIERRPEKAVTLELPVEVIGYGENPGC